MTRGKKISVSVVVLIAATVVAFLGYALMQGGRGSGMRQIDPRVSQIMGPPELVASTINQMIDAGSLPENITFDKVKSRDDVFGSGRMFKPQFSSLLPPEACSPPCTGWTFLPAAKKDSGWYVDGAGTTATDIIAYLPNLTFETCKAILVHLGDKSLIPPKQVGASFDPSKPGPYMPQGGATTIKFQDSRVVGVSGGFCFDNSADGGAPNFAYFYVLHEQ